MGKRNFRVLNSVTIYLILFLVLPVGLVLFQYPPVFSFELSLKKILVFSFEQAAISTLLSLFLGLLSGYLISKTNMRFKTLFTSLPTISFILPGLSLVMAMVILFGRNGILKINILYSIKAIIFAHTLYNFPIFMKFISDGFKSIPQSIEEDFDLISNNLFHKLRYLYLPMLTSHILSAAAIVFIYCFTSFSIVLLLGGGRYATIEVHIYMYLKRFMDFNKASGMILLQFAILSSLTFLILHFKKDGCFYADEYKIKKYKFPLWGYFLMILLTFFIFLPLLTVLLVGFIDFNNHTFTLKYMKNIFSTTYNPIIGTSILNAIKNSIVYALITSLITVTISLFSMKRYDLNTILTSTMSITPITIAFGYLLIQNNVLYLNKYLLLPLIYSILALPIAFSSISNGYKKISNFTIESAKLDGASNLKLLLYIELPLLVRSIITATIFSFSIAISEVGATLLLYDDGQYANISVAMVRFISSRRLQDARALGSLLMILTFGIFLIITYVQKRFKDVSDE